jgi:purine catabolism regulator
VQTFVEREIGALLSQDATTGQDLTSTLRTYLASGRNKTLAAAAAHLSRPAFYDRLTKIERVLGADLDDVETCLSLQVALLAHDTR